MLKKSERKANPAKDGLAGAEARLILLTLLARLKSLLKKSERKANPVKDGLAGAKARIILLTLLARLKPCRCYKAARLSFSQAVKPCRCYKAARLSFSASCKAGLEGRGCASVTCLPPLAQKQGRAKNGAPGHFGWVGIPGPEGPGSLRGEPKTY